MGEPEPTRPPAAGPPAAGPPAAGPAALRAVWTFEWHGEAADDSYPERFSAWWAAEAGRRLTWLAWAGEMPVGMVDLAVFDRMPAPGRSPSRWGYLGNAFVLPAWRSQGIGTALLTALMDHARAERFARIVLSPSQRSKPFYQRAGFDPATSLLLTELDP